MGVFSSRETAETIVASPIYLPVITSPSSYATFERRNSNILNEMSPGPSSSVRDVSNRDSMHRLKDVRQRPSQPRVPPPVVPAHISPSRRPLTRLPPLVLHNMLPPQSVPLERVPTEPMSSPPASPKTEQPTPEDLFKNYGIKVRDFAYESKLPPVPTVKRLPRTSAWDDRRLKRAIEATEEDDHDWIRRLGTRRTVPRPNMGQPVTPSPIQRKPTEPMLPSDYMHTSSQPLPSPLHASLNRSPARFDVFHRLSNILHGNASYLTSPSLHHFDSQSNLVFPGDFQVQSQSQSQSPHDSQPPLEATSQGLSDDERMDITPLATPIGSTECLVLDTSTLPESQVAPLLTESQNPSTDIPESQIGIVDSQSSHQTGDTTGVSMPKSLGERGTLSKKKSLQKSKSRSSYSSLDGRIHLHRNGDSAPSIRKRKSGSLQENEPVRRTSRYNLRRKGCTPVTNAMDDLAANASDYPGHPPTSTEGSPPRRRRRLSWNDLRVPLSRASSHSSGSDGGRRRRQVPRQEAEATVRPLRRSTRERRGRVL